MRCSKVKSLLVAYQDGELAPSAAHLVTQHLHKCERCASYNEKLFLTEVPIPDCPTVEQTIRMQIALDEAIEEAWKNPPANNPSVRRPTLRSLPLAFAVLALVSLGFWSSQHQPSTHEIQTNTTAGVVTPDKHWF